MTGGGFLIAAGAVAWMGTLRVGGGVCCAGEDAGRKKSKAERNGRERVR
jgi:hypothetical protein